MGVVRREDGHLVFNGDGISVSEDEEFRRWMMVGKPRPWEGLEFITKAMESLKWMHIRMA